MPTIKPAKAPANDGGTKRFSLVPALAQQQMYEALSGLRVGRTGAASGAEAAEIALCLALGKDDAVVLAGGGRGARKVRKDCKVIGSKHAKAQGGALAAATVTAVAALLGNPKATALVCAGPLDGGPESSRACRSAFSFAARHKLPILYLVANSLRAGGRRKVSLRTLASEFGIPVFSVDATDAIAAYRVATEAIHNARHLRGPCMIEALTLAGESSSPLELLRGYMERHGSGPR
jgi:TPP-dependent pyruvate/acetoin dehydrogenase alpha subunit